MSRRIRKPTICICETKSTDQLRSNCEADQRLCFRYTDSTIPLLPKPEITSFYRSSVTAQIGLCQTWSEPKLLVFSRTGPYLLISKKWCFFYSKQLITENFKSKRCKSHKLHVRVGTDQFKYCLTYPQCRKATSSSWPLVFPF